MRLTIFCAAFVIGCGSAAQPAESPTKSHLAAIPEGSLSKPSDQEKHDKGALSDDFFAKLGSCERGDAEACSDAAAQVSDFDSERAVTLHDRACEGGIGVSCIGVGLHHEEAHEIDAALEYYRKGCQLKDEESCSYKSSLEQRIASSPKQSNAEQATQAPSVASGAKTALFGGHVMIDLPPGWTKASDDDLGWIVFNKGSDLVKFKHRAGIDPADPDLLTDFGVDNWGEPKTIQYGGQADATLVTTDPPEPKNDAAGWFVQFGSCLGSFAVAGLNEHESSPYPLYLETVHIRDSLKFTYEGPNVFFTDHDDVEPAAVKSGERLIHSLCAESASELARLVSPAGLSFVVKKKKRQIAQKDIAAAVSKAGSVTEFLNLEWGGDPSIASTTGQVWVAAESGKTAVFKDSGGSWYLTAVVDDPASGS